MAVKKWSNFLLQVSRHALNIIYWVKGRKGIMMIMMKPTRSNEDQGMGGMIDVAEARWRLAAAGVPAVSFVFLWIDNVVPCSPTESCFSI